MSLAGYVAGLDRLGNTVYEIERRGVPVDLEVCGEIASQAHKDGVESRAWLDGYVGGHTGRVLLGKNIPHPKSVGADGDNWNYAPWLAEVMHGGRGRGLGMAPSPYWTKGQVKPGEVKTDARALDWLISVNPEHREFLTRVKKYRREQHMEGYARSWIALAVPHPDGTWRLHPSFGMASDTDDRPGAKTGRFGLKNPPLQQVPRDKRKDPYRLRRAFVAPPGHVLMVADYSQLELVILGWIANRLFGTTVLQDRLFGPDIHSATAKFVFGDTLGNQAMRDMPVENVKTDKIGAVFRDSIKEVRYGLNYCKGAWSFGSTLMERDDRGEICGPPLGEEKSQVMIDALLAFDPEIARYQEWVREFITEHAMVPSLRGRWCPLPGARSKDKWERNRAWRQACNWPMQAGGQEITGAAMVALSEAGVEQTLQVHDEIHAIVPEDRVDEVAKIMQDRMENTTVMRGLRAKPAWAANWELAK